MSFYGFRFSIRYELQNVPLIIIENISYFKFGINRKIEFRLDLCLMILRQIAPEQMLLITSSALVYYVIETVSVVGLRALIADSFDIFRPPSRKLYSEGKRGAR